MKLVTFTHAGSTRIGVATGESVVDLSAAAPSLPTEMVRFLEAGDAALDRIEHFRVGTRLAKWSRLYRPAEALSSASAAPRVARTM